MSARGSSKKPAKVSVIIIENKSERHHKSGVGELTKLQNNVDEKKKGEKENRRYTHK